MTRITSRPFVLCLTAAVLISTTAFAAAAGGPSRATHKEIEGARREIYKTVGDVRLSIDIFQPSGHQAADRRAAVVFFFGGGWTGGSVTQFVPHCRYLADRGMVAMVADYRVASRHKTSPFECVKDGKSAVRWIRANADRLGIDTARIAAGGGSAGGHVAAATGTVPGLEEPGKDAQISSRPNALLLFNPVYDNGPQGYGYSRVKARYREISPLHNIHKGMPPAIVFLGTKDKLIPVATAEAFKLKMESVGSRSELHLYQDKPHGFFNHPGFKKNADRKIYDDTITKLDRFLVSIGFLDATDNHKAK